ncbi:hypothetical protein F53441_6632 [Fusarium austroafricanum]|uniref:Clr5 domain-containing protein n=1 Tax=Fusarium austroafricanum TaxID=2364996 RepID=A0A8H4NYE6_9HYPO|nr:hypothetical protein F53441_6632 [Fusarium austroafricanum]
MAPGGLTFIESRAPRAAGLSERAVDEHKELIGDLYLSQNYTRDQVIQHLKTNLGFSLSRDQFSKATRRWGFQKQPRGGSSIQPSPNEAASQCTTSDSARNGLPSTANVDDAGDQEPILTNESSKRPRSVASSISRRSDTTTHGSSSPLPRRPVKRSKPRSESGDTPAGSLSHTQLDFATDTDLTFTPSTEEGSTESIPRYQYKYDDELSADYLACCYRYTKAFCCYCKISVPFQYQTFSPRQRRDRMLDMTRTAKTRRTSEIVRVMMESELKTSNDPLSEDGSNQYPKGEAEMCPMQSFLFHRHLAEIYAHRSDGASLVQKHLDKARGFTKAFDTLAPPSIDLWTLLRLLPGYKVTNIPEDLLNSLEWDEKSLALDMRDCLERCWGALTQTESLPVAIQHYDAGQHEKMKPTDMSHLALQNNPLYIWMKTSFLFTFFWKQIQDKAPPIWEHPTISATQFLMVVSRMIVRRSLLISKYNRWSLDSEKRLLELRASDQLVYRGVVLELLQENLFPPNQIKREFVTEFVEHYSWSPPAARKSVLVQQVQTYQIEALELVLTTRRESRPTTPTSTALREVTALREKASETRRTSTDNEFLSWLVAQQEQLASTSQRDTVIYVKGGRHTPSFDSSSVSSYLRTSSSAYHIYLNALNGNPTISRSLASQSSRSSQVSVSSSLKRFKASALNRRNSSESMMGLNLYDPGRQLQDDSFQGVQDLQVQRYFKVTMGLPTLVEDDSFIPEEEEYTSLEGNPEEDEKPTIRGRIERLLKGKGKR